MQIFYTENKEIEQLIFFVFDHFNKKKENEKWNEPDINRDLRHKHSLVFAFEIWRYCDKLCNCESWDPEILKR